MQPIEKKIIGRPLIGYLKYIKKKWGNEGLEAVEKHLGVKMKELSEDKWYLSSFSDDLVSWIATNYGQEEVRKAASSMVSEIGVISHIARVAGLDKVLDRAMDEARQNLNYGAIDVNKEPWGAIINMKDISANTESCEAWIGILEGCMKLTKTKGSVEKIACEHKGNDACVYKMTWNK